MLASRWFFIGSLPSSLREDRCFALCLLEAVWKFFTSTVEKVLEEVPREEVPLLPVLTQEDDGSEGPKNKQEKEGGSQNH